MRWASIVAALAFAGCVRSQEVTCADGRICAPGDTCDDANHRCISPTQIGACAGRAEGDACTLAGAPGACRAGACEPLICGDGVRTGTELCDGVDLGTADCTSAGYYEPAGLACTPFCTFDTSSCAGTCGDGVINGGELCDGAPPLATCVDQGFDAGALACGTSCGASFEACGLFGWRPEQTGVPTVTGIAGTRRDDLWVVGFATGQGIVAHFDGIAWTPSTISTHALTAVAEAAAGDVWALASAAGAEPNLVYHLANTQWSAVASIPAATYKDVFALDATNAYVATSDAGLLHWNGATWAAIGTLAAPLVAVRGTSTSDLWAAQTDGTLQRWNGTAWTPQTIAGTVRRIDAVAADDVWVTGSSTVTAGASLIGHWDGASWTTYVDGSSSPYTAIAARAANDVWVTQSGGSARHFDGLAWTWSFGTLTVAGSGAVGFVKLPDELASASFNGFAYRFTGQVYGRLDTASTMIGTAIWSAAPDDTFVANRNGGVVHFDGRSWTPTVVDASGQQLRVLWGRARDDVWAGGTSGHVFHFDGAGWTDRGDAGIGVNAIWGSGPDDVWFASGTVIHYDGASFTSVLSGVNSALFAAVAGTGADDVWLVDQLTTGGSDLYHWHGGAWTSTHVAQVLAALVATGPNDLFAIGGSHVLRFDGATWRDTQLPAIDPLIRIAATAPDDIFAASSSELFHFDGTRWTPVRVPADANVGGLAIQDLDAHPGRVDLLYPSNFGSQQVRRLIRTRPWNCRATETRCADGVDDDCDGHVDGFDSDCP